MAKAKSSRKSTKSTGKKQQVSKPTEAKKLTATQRIAALEDMAVVQREQINILADEADQLRSTISSLAKRLNAVIQAGEDGEINNDAINNIVLDQSVKELEGRVDYLKNQGVLKLNKDKDATVNEMTFVVGRQVDDDGNVVSPRAQFAVNSLDDELKTQMLGRKLGDLVPDKQSGTSFELTEIHNIVDPRVNKKFDEEEPPTEPKKAEKTTEAESQGQKK